MSITSGLAPIRNYANGGDVNTKRQSMLAKLGFPSGMTNEQLDAAIAEEERISGIASGFNAPKTADDLKQDVKDYVFDYTDPLEYATLPFLAPKLAMKSKKIFDAVRGPGSKTSQNLRGLGAYIGTDILARDVLGYENPFGDDALDESQKDLEDVNKKEEEDKEDKEKKEEDKELTPKQKGIMAAFAALESLGDLGNQSASTPGYMIEGTGAATPQITRYKEGGIANIDPMMMANGGIAKFAPGGKVIKESVKKGIEKLKDEYKKRKKTIEEKREAPKKSTKKSKSTDLVPYDEARAADAAAQRSRGFFDFLPVPIVAASSTAGRVAGKAGEVAKDYGKPIIGAGGLGLGAAGIGTGIYKYATSGDKELTPEQAAELQAEIDRAAAEEALKERQAAREGLTSMKDIHYARSLERAQEAGRTEPTFVDYVASFPATYGEKLGKDPEFAKQMMAGFTAMMQPSEGFVTRNAFGDFAQGVQQERVRQEGEVPDQLKLLERLKEDPELLEQYRGLNRTESTMQDAALLLSEVKRIVGLEAGVELDDDDYLVDDQGTPVTALRLSQIKDTQGSDAVIEFARSLTYKSK
jgi:hypothetical protein